MNMRLVFSIFSLLSLSAKAMEPMAIIKDDAGDYSLLKDNQVHKLRPEWIDPMVKNLKTPEQIEAFNKACYLRAVKMSDNNYKLIAQGRLHGGGVIGAIVGAFIGKAVVLGVGIGACTAFTAAATFVAGPAGTALGTGVSMTAMPFITAASVKAAIGCGILGAAMTGPV